MATKEFKLPDVGEGVAEGELVNWLVEPGDSVTEDQPVAEVETDKALVEVPSPYNGSVKELLAEEGEMVPVGDVIITFEVEDDSAETEAPDAAPSPPGDDGSDVSDATEATGRTAPEDGTAAEVEGRVFAPPSARRLARELGIDITAVEGSGPGGRVTEADVRAHAESATSGASEAPEPRDVDTTGRDSAVSRRSDPETGTGGQVDAADRDRTLAVPATRRVAREEDIDINSVPTDKTRDGEPFVTGEQVKEYAEVQRRARQAEPEPEPGPEATTQAASPSSQKVAEAATRDREPETVPYRGVRRTIGQQMERSKYTAPHVTHHDTVVVDELVDLRQDLKRRAEEQDTRLTYMPFVMKGVVAALKEFPYLNAELREGEEGEDGEILLKKEYNIGIAVATEAGLMVPVVESVDRKSMLDIAAEVNDLASRARDRKVTREEMQGGTFTITNFGAIGGEYATPIINYPETAILGLGAIEERPVVEDGEVVARHTLPLSLSIDHRIVDGAEAARFTNRVMEYLNDPRLLLLE